MLSCLSGANMLKIITFIFITFYLTVLYVAFVCLFGRNVLAVTFFPHHFPRLFSLFFLNRFRSFIRTARQFDSAETAISICVLFALFFVQVIKYIA